MSAQRTTPVAVESVIQCQPQHLVLLLHGMPKIDLCPSQRRHDPAKEVLQRIIHAGSADQVSDGRASTPGRTPEAPTFLYMRSVWRSMLNT